MRKFFTGLLFSAACLLSSGANAGLVMDVDNDAGFARFSLSGSDVVTSGASNTNGFWLFGASAVAMFDITGAPNYVLTNGSGTLKVSANSVSVSDVVLRPLDSFCCNFGIRTISDASMRAGDEIAWSGVFTTSILFSVLNEGVYDFDRLSAYQYEAAVLRDGLQIRIGNVVPVPEPGTAALVVIGLAALTYRRRRSS